MTPAGREQLEPDVRLCGRDVQTWLPAQTVDGPGVELLLVDGRRVLIDGAALLVLEKLAWRAR